MNVWLLVLEERRFVADTSSNLVEAVEASEVRF